LKIHGKTVCSKAFAALHGISNITLFNLAGNDDNVSVEDNNNMNFSVQQTKKELIIAFLELMQSSYSEPIVGDAPPAAKRITLFGCKKDVFNFFLTGEQDGIQGEFENLVAQNFDDPVSYSWFEKVWTNNFPYLYTESDKPQCVECFDFDSSKKEALQQKDNVQFQVISKKKEKHVEQAYQLFTLSKKAQAKSKVFPTHASIVVDNMASKTLPKRFVLSSC